MNIEYTSFVVFAVVPMIIPRGIIISTMSATAREGNYGRVIIGRVPAVMSAMIIWTCR